MNKNGIKKDLFNVSIITVITITVWVVLDIFLTFQKNEVPAVVKKQTEPLNPKLNIEVLDKLEKKGYFDLTEEILPQEVPSGTESANF